MSAKQQGLLWGVILTVAFTYAYKRYKATA
jgi:hypothetical protein